MEKIKDFYESQTYERKIFSVLGGFIVHIILGTVYVTGNISVYLASYLRYKGDNTTLKDMSVILPLQIVGTTIALIFGSYLYNRYNPWLTTSIGILLIAISTFATSYITSYSLLVPVYGILYGLGTGIAYTTPLLVSWSHFPNHKGRISGIIISGFGFGSFIFNFVSTHMINPSNDKATVKYHGEKYFDNHISKNVPSALRQLSLIYLLAGIFGILLISRPTKPKPLDSLVETNHDSECPSIKEGVKTKQFWVLFFMALCSIVPGLFIAGAYKVFGKTEISDDEFLTVVGSVGSVFNGSFRYVWGQLMDRFSFKSSYFCLLSIQTALIVTLYYVVSIKELYLIWISVILCCEGGHFSLFPTIIAKMYGKHMGGKIYGIFFYCFGLGAVVGFLISFYLVSVIGYQGLYWAFGGLSGISFLLMFFLNDTNLWAVQKEDTEIHVLRKVDF